MSDRNSSTNGESCRGRRLRQAFTLPELVMAVTVILLLFLITSPKLVKTQQERNEAMAAALGLVDDLRFLRMRALSTGYPAALIIPNENMSLGHCTGYILKEGSAGRKIIKKVDLSKMYRSVSLFVGTWDLDTSALKDESLINSSAPIESCSNTEKYKTWPWNGKSMDYIFLFTPSGRVETNINMPHFDGAYHIVIGESYAYRPTTLPEDLMPSCDGNLTYCYSLREVWNPVYTVSLSPLGEALYRAGVDGLPSSFYRSEGPKGPGPRGAGLVIPTAEPNSEPVFKLFRIYPEIDRVCYPESTGFDAAITPEGFVKFIVAVTDTDADQIAIKADLPDRPASQKGSFSFDTREKLQMKYNAVTERYEAVIEWYPPAGTAGDYRLSLKLTDGSCEVEKTVCVHVSLLDKMVFISDRDVGDPDIDDPALYVVNSDCSIASKLPFGIHTDLDNKSFSVSPDGKQILFQGMDEKGRVQIWCINRDLTNLRIWNGSASSIECSWSPDGTRIASASGGSVSVTYADGSSAVSIVNGRSPTWSPDMKKIAYSAGGRLYAVDVEDFKNPLPPPEELKTEDDESIGSYELEWSPDGSSIALTDDTVDSSHIYLYDIATKKKSVIYGDGSFVCRRPSWSPDSGSIVFQTNRDGNWEVYLARLSDLTVKNISNNPAADMYPQWIKW